MEDNFPQPTIAVYRPALIEEDNIDRTIFNIFTRRRLQLEDDNIIGEDFVLRPGMVITRLLAFNEENEELEEVYKKWFGWNSVAWFLGQHANAENHELVETEMTPILGVCISNYRDGCSEYFECEPDICSLVCNEVSVDNVTPRHYRGSSVVGGGVPIKADFFGEGEIIEGLKSFDTLFLVENNSTQAKKPFRNIFQGAGAVILIHDLTCEDKKNGTTNIKEIERKVSSKIDELYETHSNLKSSNEIHAVLHIHENRSFTSDKGFTFPVKVRTFCIGIERYVTVWFFYCEKAEADEESRFEKLFNGLRK